MASAILRILIGLITFAQANGQTPAEPKPRRQFEVPSIKPNDSGQPTTIQINPLSWAGGRFTATNVTLVDVLVRVYPTLGPRSFPRASISESRATRCRKQLRSCATRHGRGAGTTRPQITEAKSKPRHHLRGLTAHEPRRVFSRRVEARVSPSFECVARPTAHCGSSQAGLSQTR
jgi:hypothetical protein